jgi:hypothetical protein
MRPLFYELIIIVHGWIFKMPFLVKIMIWSFLLSSCILFQQLLVGEIIKCGECCIGHSGTQDMGLFSILSLCPWSEVVDWASG